MRKRLKDIKEEIRKNVEMFLKMKLKPSRLYKDRDLLLNKIGEDIINISEMLILKYNWNKYNSGIRFLDIENIKGRIIEKMWLGIDKIDLSKNTSKNYIYNFLITIGKNTLAEEMRKILRREKIIRFYSLERYLENKNSYYNFK